MKRTTKKICGIILALSLIVTGILAMTMSATAAELEDNLVVKYDFKGDTLTEALKDKATKGAVNDDIVLGGDESDVIWDKENGTIALAAATNNINILKATSSVDTKALDGNSTHYIRFKIGDHRTDTCYLACTWVSSGHRHTFVEYKPATKEFLVGKGFDGGSKSPIITGKYTAADNSKYINIAVTYAEKADNVTTITVYVSQEAEWVLLATEDVTGLKTSGDYRLLANIFESPSSAIIDEVRIYNATLTGEQLASELGGSFTTPTPDTGTDTAADTGAVTGAETGEDTGAETGEDTQNSGFTGPATVNDDEGKDTDSTATTETAKITDKTEESVAIEKKDGCGSLVGGSVLLMAGCVSFAGVVISKKRK